VLNEIDWLRNMILTFDLSIFVGLCINFAGLWCNNGHSVGVAMDYLMSSVRLETRNLRQLVLQCCDLWINFVSVR
jgi:hypothetical protein